MVKWHLLSESTQPRNQGCGLASPGSGLLSAGHWLLGLHHSHLGPSGKDPRDLLPEAGGSQWQHQLSLLLSFWPPGELGWPFAGFKTLGCHGPFWGPVSKQAPNPQADELSTVQASGSWDKTIHIWKPSTRSLLVQLKGHATWVKSIAFSPSGLQLASAGYSHMVTTPTRPLLLASYSHILPPRAQGTLSRKVHIPTCPKQEGAKGRTQMSATSATSAWH